MAEIKARIRWQLSKSARQDFVRTFFSALKGGLRLPSPDA
jgi:hypothetical protein